MPHRTAVTLLAATLAMPAGAQEFSFHQSCTLTLDACDLGRDGTEDCPTGQGVAVTFFSEGESFSLSVPDGGQTGFAQQDYALGQGYVSDSLRVFYILGDPAMDGVFWISVADGVSGAHLTRGGLEDYLSGSCVPQ